jgi:3-hydroxyisobutyrate dehydrogenase-like beta-hydroxyacid dehydrogenase
MPEGRVPEQVGLIGCGRMGTAMAQRLLAAGVPLTVWNRTAGKTQPLVTAGARAVATPAGLGECAVVALGGPA